MKFKANEKRKKNQNSKLFIQIVEEKILEIQIRNNTKIMNTHTNVEYIFRKFIRTRRLFPKHFLVEQIFNLNE